MNTLSDLRSTLDEHAERVPDGEAVVRTAAVRHRVSVVRRRRRAVGAGASRSPSSSAPRSAWSADRSDASPSAPPVVLGVKAPETITSLGYTYRTRRLGESVRRPGSVERRRRRPAAALLSWTTDRRHDR